MQADDPPYLSVGTAVSAKYKGAFCEAKVSKIDRMVKCKVTFKSGLGSATVSDNEIKGTLRVGQQVQVRHSESKELVEAMITKIQDCSQYTVVFDDGDITSLRRTALCLKSGRHFNESETLDQLPLTHPEHFGIPVLGGRRGRRNRLLKDESSDEEMEEEAEPDLEGYTQDIGRVVSVETGETKRGREKWFPGLIVIPSAQLTVKINVKDEFLIRSFRDDRYYTVPKKEVNEFTRDLAEKIDSAGLAEAIQKAIKFLDTNELPLHWEKNSLFNSGDGSDSDDNGSDTSDDEQSEEKDHFVAQLYKYMDDSGTPLNKTPTISGKDIDLHRLFRIVDKMGGYNRATNQNKWKSVAAKIRLSVNQNVANQVKAVYKKSLLSYEGFFRTLGVTMSNPTRLTKKDKGRSLIRDKDRTPMSSPRPDRDDEPEKPIERKTPILKEEKTELKTKRRSEVKDLPTKKPKPEPRDASGDVSDTPSTSSTRSKRLENKVKEKKTKSESKEEVVKKEEKIVQQVQITRSKSLPSVKPQMVTTRQSKEINKPKVVKENKEEKRKSSKKKELDEPPQTAIIGDKLIVYYGPTNESKVTYEAKVVDMDKDQTGPIYLVHYTGWNTRYDEWIPALRIAENLSSGTKTKRCKVPAPVNVKPSTSGLKPQKRSRLTSVSGRPSDDKPRSTTPSSGGSSKSPANVGTRSIRLAAKKEKLRRTSAQTDISIPSESESDSSESEPELPRTRSGSIKPDENELKTYKRRLSKPSPLPRTPKRKDEDGEKDDEIPLLREKRIVRKPKKLSDKSTEESEDEDEESCSSLPKGRDFDLNQIRSELKGFSKPMVVDKENDSEDSEITEIVKEEKEEEVKVEKEEPPKPKTPPPKLTSPKVETPSSDDIYEFKEPEPFEFESRSKLVDDKNPKKRPRIFDSLDDKSPRKKPMSPEKAEPRTYSRVPKKIHVSEDEDDKEDPFDKLIESASFNFDSEQSESKEENATSDEGSRDVELSDCDSQQKEESPSPDTCQSKSPVEEEKDTIEAKVSEDEDFQTQIQLAIARSASPIEDSDASKSPEPSNPKEPEETPKSEPSSPKRSIDPALQETDSSLLELIVSKPPLILNPQLDETVKELSVKTGTKIADSILEKFSFIKKNIEELPVVDPEPEVPAEEVPTEAEPVEDKLIEDCKKSESDDSSIGSENLVIGSDDESAGNVEEEQDKPDDGEDFPCQNETEVQVEEQTEPTPPEQAEEETRPDKDKDKDKEPCKEEQDPSLHSLLLCEEEIPRSPAPALELPVVSEIVATPLQVHEIPFASAPGTSNSKMLIEPMKPLLIIPPAEVTVLENSPPSTPESTISNLSPKSPFNNDSKSNEAEPELEEQKPKVAPYDEEDTQPGTDLPSPRKADAFGPPAVYRKRRRSLRNSEDGSSGPVKRGRKPRPRRDSDSDDASENSLISGRNTPGSTSVYDRSARSPRPSKYNFFVEFDPNLDSTQRIQLLQQKLSEIRKTYADVKAELATVERRRKRIRRREREALKNAKQEVVCA